MIFSIKLTVWCVCWSSIVDLLSNYLGFLCDKRSVNVGQVRCDTGSLKLGGGGGVGDNITGWWRAYRSRELINHHCVHLARCRICSVPLHLGGGALQVCVSQPISVSVKQNLKQQNKTLTNQTKTNDQQNRTYVGVSSFAKFCRQFEKRTIFISFFFLTD